MTVNNQMDTLDILYTPLDTADIPQVDIPRLMQWMSTNNNQYIINRRDASKKTEDNLYPWDICYAKEKGHWKTDFTQQFPVLADYFSSAYGLEPDDVKTVVMLPNKPDFSGVGFWHSDPDETGLRMYLENEDHDTDFLLLKSTIKKYNTREELGLVPNNGIDPARFNPEILSAKILKPRQTFFLNNLRAIHAAKISQGKFRVAILVILNVPFSQMPTQVVELIRRSAAKYPDLAVVRQD
jgi:hypothetical protein